MNFILPFSYWIFELFPVLFYYNAAINILLHISWYTPARLVLGFLPENGRTFVLTFNSARCCQIIFEIGCTHLCTYRPNLKNLACQSHGCEMESCSLISISLIIDHLGIFSSLLALWVFSSLKCYLCFLPFFSRLIF